MKYQVMIQELGKPLVQIGEAEIEQLTGHASGRFVPGPGYAAVRHVFLLRKQGKRDLYLDERDLLRPQLYHEGLPMHASAVDIDDPDRIEAELGDVELLEGAAVGSMDELVTAMVQRCPTCGGPTRRGDAYYALPASRYAARVVYFCRTCGKSWFVMYEAKPTWKAP